MQGRSPRSRLVLVSSLNSTLSITEGVHDVYAERSWESEEEHHCLCISFTVFNAIILGKYGSGGPHKMRRRARF